MPVLPDVASAAGAGFLVSEGHHGPSRPTHPPTSAQDPVRRRCAADRRQVPGRVAGGSPDAAPIHSVDIRDHLRRYVIPRLGELALHDLALIDIEAAYRTIETDAAAARRPMSAATMRRIHATLTSALIAAVRRGLLLHNPAKHLELRPAPFPQTRTWTANELTRFLAGTERHRLHPLFLTLAVTGLRRGDTLGLRWADLDLEHGVIRVGQQIVVVGARLETGPPKPTPAGAPSRSLAGSPKRCAGTPPGSAWTGSLLDWRDSGLVFTTATGQPLHPRRCPASSTDSPHKQAYHRFESMTCGTPPPPSAWPAARQCWKSAEGSGTPRSPSPPTSTPTSPRPPPGTPPNASPGCSPTPAWHR